MKSGRSSAAEQTRARLLDLWRGEEAFGRPLGCVTTSFTFDAELFEEQCLARFLSIQSNPNETAKAYLIEREEKLSQCFACVLVDRAHAAPDRSLRWHMLPVTLPKGGVLHAKLTVLLWENCVRILIGSANLTEPAYRRNQEVMAALDFGAQSNPAPELLTQCVTFLNRVRRFAPGFERSEGGPQAALAAFLSSIELRARSLPPAEREEADCVLVPLVPGGDTIVEQLKVLWTGPMPDRAWVLSPFFDDDKQSSVTAAAFAGLLTTRGDRWLTVTAPGRTLPDGTVQIDAPATLKKSSHPSLQHDFSIVQQRMEIDGKQEDRVLHAKSVWLERDGRALYMLGSSNFTAAGLGLHPRHNIELNVAYLIRDCGSRLGKLCVQSWPAETALDDLDHVQFLGGLTDSGGGSDKPPLPAAFGSALYCLDENGARLELEIGDSAPPVFHVWSKEGASLIDSAGWLHGGKQRVVAVPWESKRPPSSLDVSWHDRKIGECRAPWVVNVADLSALPPPDELGSLSLTELIEILTSARPLHEVILRILKRREEKTGPAKNVEIDPHKKVDTSQFLLRRMRRVAHALEGLRARLQQPVASLEALRWRLRGPIGPITLAKRLADEVGMGKTFVALGVAMVAALTDRGRRPVVIMVPSSLHEKWPREFDVFRDLAIKLPNEKKLQARQAASALDFFRLIDNDAKDRPHIIFLKHGAFHVQNIDQWVRLALIKRAILGMHLGEKRNALPRFAAGLLRTKSSFNDPELFARLLNTPNREWRSVINNHCETPPLQDDPIPDAIQKVIDSSDIDIAELRECLRELPARESASIDERLETARRAINKALQNMWPSTLAKARFRSPLLILDEAHHLKNPATRLASLFVTDDAQEDAGTITGALDGAFERMIFLTATPFQLGHHELLNVIGRFKGIAWRTMTGSTKEEFEAELEALRSALDQAQYRAAELDKRWPSLRQDDLVDQNDLPLTVDAWWRGATENVALQPERVQILMRAFEQTRKAMKDAEVPLRKWVIRHLRDPRLPGTDTARRSRLVGRAISLSANGRGGLPVEDDALLPFLLAARAQAVVLSEGEMAGRATFAEGLASSYEAFLETRNRTEVDEQAVNGAALGERANRYVQKLATVLPNETAYAQHPKIAPLIARVLDLWRHREKVVIFCHYRETGRALVRHLSAALECQLWHDAAQRFNLDHESVQKAVTDFGGRFDTEGGMRQPLHDELARRLAQYAELDGEEQELIQDVIRRFVRTPLFVGRYFDIHARSGEQALTAALDTRDMSGASLGEKIDAFLKFIAKRCSPRERAEYLDALNRMQPGIRGETHRDKDDDLSQMKEVTVMPNIRLANGLVKQETRQRLMLAFNTPFFPEVLVASSVLAEGVDLHLSCRYVIHHDLSWNPSTLEQRTGRVDRIGAKAETVRKPIEVFLPYIGGTQDEKQYRVVMDRERWFQVLMGEEYRTDESYTEKSAERIPLPLAAAEALAFDLSVKLD